MLYKKPLRYASTIRSHIPFSANGVGLINYKDTKTKSNLYWCLIEFIDWRYSHVGIFDPAL